MIILALNRQYCLNSQFGFCCSNEISKLIPHCQDRAAAGNEACSLQVTEVSGTNVTSKRVTAPFVCSALSSSEAAQSRIPKAGVSQEEGIFFLLMCMRMCVCFQGNHGIEHPSFDEWVARYRKLLIFLLIYLIQSASVHNLEKLISQDF